MAQLQVLVSVMPVQFDLLVMNVALKALPRCSHSSAFTATSEDLPDQGNGVGGSLGHTGWFGLAGFIL